MATQAAGSGLVGYNVEAAVDSTMRGASRNAHIAGTISTPAIAMATGVPFRVERLSGGLTETSRARRAPGSPQSRRRQKRSR